MMELMCVDFHAHILPGCDHGSKSLKTSEKQLEYAALSNVKTVCATPHFYPHVESVDKFLKRRTKSFEELKTILTPKMPDILLGAEVLVCEGMENMEGIEKLCLEGTKLLLLEMPFFKWSEALITTVLSIAKSGDVEVVIAHADRYSKADIEIFIRNNIPLQLNIDAFSNVFKRKRFKNWVKKGYVKYIGSDIHGVNNAYGEWNKYKKILNV